MLQAIEKSGRFDAHFFNPVIGPLKTRAIKSIVEK
jgi:hypothetical protein